MDIDALVHDSFAYTREALWERWVRWFQLLIASIIFPVFLGYSLRIYRGDDPAPDPEGWIGLFIDGVKLFLIGAIYLIPVLALLVAAVFLTLPFFALIFTDYAVRSVLALVAVGGTALLVILIVWLVLMLLSTIGVIRFARTGRMREAFRAGAILGDIRAIGWGNYLLALTILWLISMIFHAGVALFQSVPLAGWVVALFLMPAWGIYSVRFITLIYERGVAGSPS
ncbi:MAG: DUF4013 domain-containing protein [Methanomicrobiaceae archaeon]|nr:DUF4013 domain-containing protein [Methanomicrobiaceae archaeon]